jgi:4-hydroxy-3-methylbut-2-en-1-yl diphosphate reductase
MDIEINNKSGFCFGVVKAVEMAEKHLQQHGSLYCLGEMVHNQAEMERLEAMGLKTIDHAQLQELYNCTVLIRAHGEPPSTYETAKKNNISLIEATCPVVLKLQQRVKAKFEEVTKAEGQLVIYGKKGHAEVIGLSGQTGHKAIVVSSGPDLEQIDFSKPVKLFSQTTMPKAGFEAIKEQIALKMGQSSPTGTIDLEARNTVCGHVSCRAPALEAFSQSKDVVLFVSGKNSSNGKMLYEVCKKNNPRSHFISGTKDIQPEWFEQAKTIGVCGATSTPVWQMQQVVEHVKNLAT